MQPIEPPKRGKTISEASNAETQSTTASVANKYISPYSLKEWFAWVRGLSWVWSKKQTFSEGINVGNNANPQNGDVYSNGTDIYAYLGGAVRNILTSQNGKVGRVLFVSKDGNNSSGTVGSMNFSYSSLQGAINSATNPQDVVIVFTGNYAESVTFSRSNLTIILVNATVQSIVCTHSNNTRIQGLGKSVVTTLSWGDDNSGNGHGYIEGITIGTWQSGYRGTCNFSMCVIGNLVVPLGCQQFWKAKNCTFNNIATNSVTSTFSNADFHDCTFNSCSFQGIAGYAIFTICRLNSCVFNHYTPKLLFSFCKAKSTIFNFGYLGAMPNAHCLFVADNTTFAGFALNNNTSSTAQTIVFTLSNVITDKDFNTLLASNITYDLLDQKLVTSTIANKFVV
jgi:hypothetical protein